MTLEICLQTSVCLWAPSVYLSAHTASFLALRLESLVPSPATESKCAGWAGGRGLGEAMAGGGSFPGLASWTFHSPGPLSLRMAKQLDRQAKEDPLPGLP